MSLSHFEYITLQKSQFLVNKNISLSQSFNTNKHIRDNLKILIKLLLSSWILRMSYSLTMQIVSL